MRGGANRGGGERWGGGRGRDRGRGRGRHAAHQQDPPDPVPGRLPPAVWKHAAENQHVKLKNFDFHEVEGLSVRMESENPLDFVNLYLTDQFWNLLVTETNRFARQFLANNPPNTHTGLWTPVNVNEMKSFITIIILMGINHKPSLPMYWSVDDFLYTPIFSQIMTRNHFCLILRFLHFNDIEDPHHVINDETWYRLHKVRPLINLFQLFKGRLKFRQCITPKRARFRIKLYELCTSDGITLDFLVYCGKGMFSNDAPNSNMPATERIPSVLMSRHLGKGHILYTDNYYTSPTFASYFLQN